MPTLRSARLLHLSPLPPGRDTGVRCPLSGRETEERGHDGSRRRDSGSP